MTTAQTLTLTDAIRAVVADFRDEGGDPTATVADAVACTRDEVDLDDIDVLAAPRDDGPWMSADLAEAYRVVLAAAAADVYAAADEVHGGEQLEVVSVTQDADAAVACAAAAAAAAAAASQARDEGDEDAVGVVVVEDVTAECDVDED